MAMNLLAQTIDQLSREKGIDPEIVITALEDAMVVAARKYYKAAEELRAEFDRKTGSLQVFAVRKVVEEVTDPLTQITLAEAHELDPEVGPDGEVHIAKPTDVLGRIAAQTARQVIMQKVREAERDIVYAEYSGRVGELVNCIVKRQEGPEIIVELGRYEARLPKREQSRLEAYHIGDRLRAVIKEVDRASKGPQVIISRGDPALVQRLFEMEVPEIYDGTVQVRAIAREAGERTKIAVLSKDRDVDAVGACVGMKGMRVQSIIRELRGEKIDIIEWNEDPISFATNALSPAKVSRVSVVDAQGRQLEVVVEDSQLSLAIGRKGQNVRLASKLLDWHIDIKSEEEKRQEVEAQMAGMAAGNLGTPLAELKGIGEKTKEKLGDQSVATIEALAAMTPEQLMAISGIGEKMVQKIALAVKAHFEPEAPVVGQEEAASAETPVTAAEPEEEIPVHGNGAEELETAEPEMETAAEGSAAEETGEEAEVVEEAAAGDGQKVE